MSSFGVTKILLIYLSMNSFVMIPCAAADLIDLLLEGVALCGCLLQFCDFLFGFFYFTIAVSSHLLEIRVRNTVVCGKLQELILLPICLIDDVILLFDLFPE